MEEDVIVRRFLRAGVLVVTVWLLLRTWLVQGIVVPLEVSSGSMAETLLGPHRDVTCGDCGYRFPCAADPRRVRPKATCPLCGFAGNDLGGQSVVRGDRLVVDRSAFCFRRPRRWEPIAFCHPEHARQIVVKRVVGLPGESVRVDEGDVFIDGRRARKTLAQQRALAVLVDDADHLPASRPAAGRAWRPASQGSAWQCRGGRFVRPPTPPRGDVDWIVYHHQRRLPGSPGQLVLAPVTNLRGYNQSRVFRSRQVHAVGDLMLTFRVRRWRGEGALWVRLADPPGQWLLRLDPAAGRFELSRGEGDRGSAVAVLRGRLGGDPRGATVTVSLIDRQWLFALGETTTATLAIGPRCATARPTTRPVALGSSGLGVEIERVRLWRDVYYTHPIGPEARDNPGGACRLGPGEYYVLGDNSLVSIDSRQWAQGPAVPAKFLVGKPLAVHLPSRMLRLGGREFQVPDPRRIRYIR